MNQRPTPYYVGHLQTTPDEPLPGFYWYDDNLDKIRGPFATKASARDSVATLYQPAEKPL